MTVFRAGIVASDLAGFPYNDGGVGDFAQENELIKHLRGDDQRAIVARASRHAEATLRADWKEAEALVERLIAERTIRFDTPTRSAAPAIPWAARRAALDAKHGAATVDAELYFRWASLTWLRRTLAPVVHKGVLHKLGIGRGEAVLGGERLLRPNRRAISRLMGAKNKLPVKPIRTYECFNARAALSEPPPIAQAHTPVCAGTAFPAIGRSFEVLCGGPPTSAKPEGRRSPER